MEIRTQSHELDSNRITVLVLQSDSFEEERILTAITQAITQGGRIITEIPVGDDNVRCVEFVFHETKKKRRKNG